MGMLCHFENVNLATYQKLRDSICTYYEIRVASQSNVWVCGHLLSGIAGAWILRHTLKICLGELLS